MTRLSLRRGSILIKAIMLVLFVGGWMMTQASQDQPQNPAQDKQGQVTVQGCVSRSGGDFILMQSDPGNSYVLRTNRKIKLDHYLGQQVEVTGNESSTTSTSSTSKKAGSSVMIMVDSINTISKRCVQ
jgi:hypothetical protein